MTAVLTPDLLPFFAGTYFPKVARKGMPGLMDLLGQLARAWQFRRPEVDESAQSILAVLQQAEQVGQANETTSADWVDAAAVRAQTHLLEQFDPKHGGYGYPPKFLVPHTLMLMLEQGDTSDRPSAAETALFTLRKMVSAGVNDQLGGGFHRYATDWHWRIPHFEKMLYDQAMMVMALTRAHQHEPQAGFDTAVHRTAEFLMRELRSPEGAFFSSLDADSEGEEGRFYSWTPGELAEVLGEADAVAAQTVFGWRGRAADLEGGRYVLEVPEEPEELANSLGLSVPEALELAHHLRLRLLEARGRRVRPGLDDKVLTDWNGLAIAALARAGSGLGVPAWIEAARTALNHLLDSRLSPTGHLLHTFNSDPKGIPGMLDDYAFLTYGAACVAKATGDPGALQAAETLFQGSLERFLGPDGGFYSSSSDAVDVIVRQRPLYDGAIPSGNSMQLMNCALLAELTGNPHYKKVAMGVKSAFRAQVAGAPWAFNWFLLAAQRI